MIRFENVSKIYHGSKNALQQVTFDLKIGEMAFLTGHSGAGKSTLLKLIAGIEFPSKGKIYIGGNNITRIKKSQIPYLRRNIGIVFQDHKLLPEHSVFDNVALPLVIAGVDVDIIKRRVSAALDKVGLLNKRGALPIHLSGGEQQRVGIARAVVNKPDILIADEPTGNLDPGLSMEIMRLFEEFNHTGTTVLLATHDLSIITKLEHKTLTLNNGQLYTN